MDTITAEMHEPWNPKFLSLRERVTEEPGRTLYSALLLIQKQAGVVIDEQ